MRAQTTDHYHKGRRKTSQTSRLGALRSACTRESDALWLRRLYTLSGQALLSLLLICPVGFILARSRLWTSTKHSTG